MIVKLEVTWQASLLLLVLVLANFHQKQKQTGRNTHFLPQTVNMYTLHDGGIFIHHHLQHIFVNKILQKHFAVDLFPCLRNSVFTGVG